MKPLILPLWVLLGAGLLNSCSGPAEDLTALKTELQEANDKLDAERKAAATLRAQLAAMGDTSMTGETAITAANAESQALATQMKSVLAEFLVYRDAYRDSIRARAPGMVLEDFEMLGRKFSKVTVKTVDDWELAFKHQNGVTRVSLADAPPELRIMFAYNPNVGPKPAPDPLLASAGSPALPPGVGGGSSAAAGGGGGGASSAGARGSGGSAGYAAAEENLSRRVGNDPFERHSGSTVGDALGRFAGDAPDEVVKKQGYNYNGKVRTRTLADGSVVEVLADWGN